MSFMTSAPCKCGRSYLTFRIKKQCDYLAVWMCLLASKMVLTNYVI